MSVPLTDDCAVVRQQDPGDQVEQRALARAALARERDLFARAERELPNLNHFNFTAIHFTETFAQIAKFQHGFIG